MRKRILLLVAAAFVLAAFAQAAGVTLDVKEHVLKNGMKILMIPKPGVPRVVCHIYFKVGSINERPGITGSAHVHEHLMFKGTEVMGVTDYAADAKIDGQIDELMDRIYREKYWKTDGDAAKIAAWQKEFDALVAAEKAFIIKDDLWTRYMSNGGTGLNASTSQETTGYYVTLPSNKIELQMLMESDRLMNARFREFYSEKDVIMEERRLSENQPGYFFGEQVDAAFFAASPYHWDVIGWMDDLKKMTKQDLVDFHNRYYVPNNAVAIYVGDFDPAAVIAAAAGLYARLRRRPDVQALLSSGTCHYEVPFSFAPHDRPGEPNRRGEIVRGVIDCLVVPDAGPPTVVEFKTGEPRPEHEAQASRYGAAVQAVLASNHVNIKILYA